MKSFRLCLLIVLMALLPLRGALAAAMLCPVAGAGVQVEAQPMAHGHSHEAGGESFAHHPFTDEAHAAPVPVAPMAEGASHHHADAGHHSHAGADSSGGGGSSKCNVCSAYCSVQGVASTPLALASAAPAAALFPHLTLPAPSFVAEGPERPPRSI